MVPVRYVFEIKFFNFSFFVIINLDPDLDSETEYSTVIWIRV